MSTLALEILASIAGVYRGDNDLSTLEQKFAVTKKVSFANGAGLNQANKVFSDTRSLSASSSEDLDLNGTLTDGFGATFSPTKIKALMISAAAANTNDVVVGGAASNGFVSMFGSATDKVKIPPGGLLLLTAPTANGFALTAATADLLKIANGGSGSSVTFDIVVIGA